MGGEGVIMMGRDGDVEIGGWEGTIKMGGEGV